MKGGGKFRPNNQRVHRSFDKHEQMHVRGYDKQQRDPMLGTYTSVGVIRRYINKVIRFFRSFFSMPSIGLDLTSDDIYGENPGRGAGAAWLRGAFHGNLKMISTRDGRKV